MELGSRASIINEILKNGGKYFVGKTSPGLHMMKKKVKKSYKYTLRTFQFNCYENEQTSFVFQF